jgi:hypothetical protein
MQKWPLLSACVIAAATAATSGVRANEELIKLSQNPQNWAMPGLT